MFTTQHYRAIAEIIASHQTDPNHCERCADKRQTLSLLTYDLACMFVRDNPLFGTVTFYRACGFDPTSPEVESEQRAIARQMGHSGTQ